MKITFIIDRDGKKWHAHCPELRGLHVDGKTAEEALRIALRAALVYLDSMRRHGDFLTKS